MAFVASALPDGISWSLDGRTLDERGTRALWSPAPGKHVLSLVDARGLAVSTVAFEVRGR
jgi:penicillin-binding protein 1C